MIVQNGREARITDSLKYNFYRICEIMPKQICKQIFMVYTNCRTMLDLNFDHSVIHEVFELDTSIKIPKMYLDNPFVYVKRA